MAHAYMYLFVCCLSTLFIATVNNLYKSTVISLTHDLTYSMDSEHY